MTKLTDSTWSPPTGRWDSSNRWTPSLQWDWTPPRGWTPPNWWCTPAQQLELAHRLWPYDELLLPPENFTPRSESEVLLLHVPRSFERLWDVVTIPRDCSTDRASFVRISHLLRLIPGREEFTSPVWLGFDPESYRGLPAFKARNQIQSACRGGDAAMLAASEVLSALIQFKDWPLAWRSGASQPIMSGYTFATLAYEANAPYIHWTYGDKGRLRLHSRWHDLCDDGDASPVIREC